MVLTVDTQGPNVEIFMDNLVPVSGFQFQIAPVDDSDGLSLEIVSISDGGTSSDFSIASDGNSIIAFFGVVEAGSATLISFTIQV